MPDRWHTEGQCCITACLGENRARHGEPICPRLRCVPSQRCCPPLSAVGEPDLHSRSISGRQCRGGSLRPGIFSWPRPYRPRAVATDPRGGPKDVMKPPMLRGWPWQTRRNRLRVTLPRSRHLTMWPSTTPKSGGTSTSRWRVNDRAQGLRRLSGCLCRVWAAAVPSQLVHPARQAGIMR